MKRLHRHYGKLEPLERFQAVLAATERGDEAERRVLVQAAPKATYQQVAWPYSGMIAGCHVATWATVTDVLRLAVIMLLAWGRWRHEGDSDNADEGTDDEVSDPWRTARETAEELTACWNGLGALCEELGITLEQAMTQAPATHAAQGAVAFASMILALEEDFCLWLAEEVCEAQGEELDAILSERAERIEKHRRDKAQGYADELRQIWQMNAYG